jgi:hypothetical protein
MEKLYLLQTILGMEVGGGIEDNGGGGEFTYYIIDIL